MTGFHQPENRDDDSNETQERKLPDFIFIDQEEERFQGYGQEFDPKIKQIARREYSFLLRFFCLFLSLTFFIVTALAFLFFSVFLFVNLITFFKLKDFWRRTKVFWEQLKKALVAGLGFAVAVFSPPFGLSIIMVYLLLKGSAPEEDWMSRMMRHRFYQ